MLEQEMAALEEVHRDLTRVFAHFDSGEALSGVRQHRNALLELMADVSRQLDRTYAAVMRQQRGT